MDEEKNCHSLGVDKYIVYEDGGKYCSDHEKVAEWGELRGRKWEWGGGLDGGSGVSCKHEETQPGRAAETPCVARPLLRPRCATVVY